MDTAICNECAKPIPFTVLFDDGSVYLEKLCPSHGRQRVLLSTDASYYRRAHTILSTHRSSPGEQLGDMDSVPYMVIVEAVDECDMQCPTCIAASTPNSGNFRNADALITRVATLAATIGKLELIMVSGGEPTLHPDILRILHALRESAVQVMLITNGVRIANDVSFARDLATLGPQLEVYLQYDSLRPYVLQHLRGSDCSDIRERALCNLAAHEVSATLVCVVKKGFNDDELADIVRSAVARPNVRGVTFQPIRASGRHREFDFDTHCITLSEVRTTLLSDLRLPTSAMWPYSRNPENACIGYFARDLRPNAKQHYDSSEGQVRAMEPLYRPKHASAPHHNDDPNPFRIAIISFLDRYNYTTSQSRRGGIVFLNDDGNMIPLAERFLFPGYMPLMDISVRSNETQVDKG